MRRLASTWILICALGVGADLGATSSAPARPDETAQTQTRFRSRLSDRQLQTILARFRTNTEQLLRIVDGTPPRGRAWGNYQRQASDVAYLVEDLLTATNHLDDHISRAITTRTDVDDLLRRAVAVDEAMRRSTQQSSNQTLWNNIRRDVDGLATSYGLRWDWQRPEYSNEPAAGIYRRLEGTYTLDVARSDNAQRTIDQALRNVAVEDRARASRQLRTRLDAPDMVAIDRTDRQIIVASSRGPQLTFEADGQPRTEQFGGQTVTTRAGVYGDQLNVTTTGMANNEFYVTFEPLRAGEDLRVTRRVYLESLDRPVSLQTIYRRTATTPDWELLNRPASTPARSTWPDRSNVAVIVPDGTVLTGRLDQTVNVRDARAEDRITLTVHNAARAEFEGATIEGYVINRSSVLNDRARLSIEFDQIRLRNGRSGDFSGVIEQITSPNGQTIRFDGELASVDRNSPDALKRGAIGAAIGGLIGALAGGTKGAIIGAAIGGGGAAATVLLDNNSGQIELVRGTEFRIRTRSQ